MKTQKNHNDIFAGINNLVTPAIERSLNATPETKTESSARDLTVLDIEREVEKRLKELPIEDRIISLGL